MDEKPTIKDRLIHAWNIFRNRDDQIFKWPNQYVPQTDIGVGYSFRPDRIKLQRGYERSIINSIFNRISLDVSVIQFRHVRLDETGRYLEDIDSPLDICLSVEANKDQTSRAFIQDIVMSMMDEGVVAVIPVETNVDPETGAYNIFSMRVAQILEWYPNHIKVRAYDERDGNKKDIIIGKSNVAIIENPFYAIMNEPNSTMQRLIHKLNLLDVVDEQSSSGKLDLIIQLPYVIKSAARKIQAEQRRSDIESQLKDSKYGIAYTDATEKIVQLNRPVENNLMKQIEYLTELLFSQLGITQKILDGTADEATMTNYYNRVIEPIVSAITDEMFRKFLTKTARTQKQSIMSFRDPLRLVPTHKVAEMSDSFIRNEIMSPNEIRQIIGMKPSGDPRSDELSNRNINPMDPNAGVPVDVPSEEGEIPQTGNYQDNIVEELLAGLEAEIGELFGGEEVDSESMTQSDESSNSSTINANQDRLASDLMKTLEAEISSIVEEYMEE